MSDCCLRPQPRLARVSRWRGPGPSQPSLQAYTNMPLMMEAQGQKGDGGVCRSRPVTLSPLPPSLWTPLPLVPHLGFPCSVSLHFFVFLCVPILLFSICSLSSCLSSFDLPLYVSIHHLPFLSTGPRLGPNPATSHAISRLPNCPCPSSSLVSARRSSTVSPHPPGISPEA